MPHAGHYHDPLGGWLADLARLPHFGCTTGTRAHPNLPYGHAIARFKRGRKPQVAHLLRGCIIGWNRGRPVRLIAYWRCQEFSSDARLVGQIPDGWRLCAACQRR